MKKSHLFCCCTFIICLPCDAGVLRHDMSIQEYRDFAENLGKYRLGVSNIAVNKKNGDLDGILNFSMPDFSMVADGGYATLVSSSYIASVRHNGGYQSVEFGNGAKYFTNYRIINRNETAAGSDIDFHLPRLNKVVTDAAPVDAIEKNLIRTGNPDRFPFYTRVGAGTQAQISDDQTQEIHIADYYNWKTGGTISTESVLVTSTNGTLRWYNYAPDHLLSTPLTTAVLPGDSGSPVFVFDEQDKKWKITGVMHAMIYNGGPYQRISGAEYIPDGFMDNILSLNRVSDVTDVSSGGIITWGENEIAQGSNTWVWQGLDAKYRHTAPGNVSLQELDATKDLRFNGSGKQVIRLEEAVNMGAAKLRFSNDYTLSSSSSKNATWVGGGIEIDEDKRVLWQVNGLADDVLHKIGKGTLHVNAEGVNPGSLNMGDGTVILDQQADAQGKKQAFERITLVSGRPTLVLGGSGQIDSDKIQFGYRGGKLDLNGHNMSFSSINHTDAGARISNNNLLSPALLTLTGSGGTKADVYRGVIGDLTSYKSQGVLDLRLNLNDSASLTALTGGMNIKGNVDIDRGILLLSGQPVPHAGQVVIDDDWSRALFRASSFNVAKNNELQLGEYGLLHGDINGGESSIIKLGYIDSNNDAEKIWRCVAPINGGETCSKPQRSSDELNKLPTSMMIGDINLAQNGNLHIGKAYWKGKVSAADGSMNMNSTASWQMTGDSFLKHLDVKPGANIRMLPDDRKNWQPKTLNVKNLTASGVTMALGFDPVAGISDSLVIEQSATGGMNIMEIHMLPNTQNSARMKRDLALINAPAGLAHDYFTFKPRREGFSIYTPDVQVKEIQGRSIWSLKAERFFASENSALIQNTQALMGTRQYVLSEAMNRLHDRTASRQMSSSNGGAWVSIGQDNGAVSDLSISQNTLALGWENERDMLLFGVTAGYTQGKTQGQRAEQEKHRLASGGLDVSFNLPSGWFAGASTRYMRLMQDISLDPVLGIRDAKANTDIFAGSIKSGYQLAMEQQSLVLAPSITFGMAHLSGYTLDGGSASVAVSSATPYFVSPGLSLTKNLGHNTQLIMDASWQYAPGSEGAKVSLTDKQTQRVTDALSDNRYRTALGINSRISKNGSINGRLEHSFGGELKTDFNINAGITYRF